MNRLINGLRRTTAAVRDDRRRGASPAPPIAELAAHEQVDGNSLARPSSRVSRTTFEGQSNSYQGNARISRHSRQIPSISSIHETDNDVSSNRASSDPNRRLSLDPGLRKLTNYFSESYQAHSLSIAYLMETGMRCDDYLRLHQDKAETVRSRAGRGSRTSLDQGMSMLTASIELTIQEIETKHYEASQMLEVLAFVDNAHVCHEVFARSTPPMVIRTIVSSRLAFDNALAQLQRFGLVEKANWYYHIHGAVHAWTLGNALKVDQSLLFVKYAARCVIDAFETTNRSFSWFQCLIHHAEHLLSPKLFDFWLRHVDNQEVFDCLEGLTRVLAAFGREAKVFLIFQRILAFQRKGLGQAHPSTCKTMWQIGRQYALMQEYLKAENFLNQALAGFETVDGCEEFVIWVLIDLTKNYRYRRIFGESEKMLRLASYSLFKIPERFRNPKQVLDHHIESGKLSRSRGHLEEAESRFKVASSYAEEKFGGSGRCDVELGSLYLGQQRFEQARVCLEQALKDHQRNFGLDGQDLQTLVTDLSYLYSKTGHHDQAAQLYRRFDSDSFLDHVPQQQTIRNSPHQQYNMQQLGQSYGHHEMPP